MPLQKDFMATPLNENLSHTDVTFAESPSEKSNSRFYYSEKKRMNVQHFLQATSVIIGKKRHRF
jgi:hypothetical protein